MVTQIDPKEQKALAVAELKSAMNKIPFNLATAGAVRVEAFKVAVKEAQKLINRNPPEHWKYIDARRRIEATATLEPAQLQRQVLGLSTEG